MIGNHKTLNINNETIIDKDDMDEKGDVIKKTLKKV